MAIPEQVKKQAQNAEDLHKKMYGNPDESAPEVPEVPVADLPGAETPPAETPPAPVVGETETPGVAPEPTIDTPETPPEPPKEMEAVSEDGKYWLQRFKVVTGQFDKFRQEAQFLNDELVRYSNVIKSQGQLIEELQLKIGAGTAPEAKPSEPPQPSIDIRSMLSDEDKQLLEDEAISDNVLNLFGKLTQSAVASAVGQVTEKTQNLEKDFATKTEDDFWRTLDTQVPGWESINQMTEWKMWLRKPIPYTNMTRQQKLDEAQTAKDSNTVIQMFVDFAKEHQHLYEAPPAPPVDEIPPAPPVPPEMPEASGHAPPPVDDNPQGRKYTRQEINEFYRMAAIGTLKINGRPATEAEIEAISADIDRANVEGRIIG
jgi:hypothetical protein